MRPNTSYPLRTRKPPRAPAFDQFSEEFYDRAGAKSLLTTANWHAEALEHQKAAHAIFLAALPEDSTDASLAASHLNLGVTQGNLGDHAAALAAFEKAEAIFAVSVPPEHPHRAMALQNIARCKRNLERQPDR